MGESIFVVGVVIAIAVLAARAVADRLGVPDAVLFVLFGGLATLLPGIPSVVASPDVVLLLLLPPLVYYAGFGSDPRAARSEALSITGLAVGLVLVTTLLVAVVVHELTPQEVGWAESLALGAAVSPPDPVAASSVLQRLGAPRRLSVILQGEGLVNDGTALTTFAVAVVAVQQQVTAGYVVLRTLEEVAGGLAWGLVVGFVVAKLRKFLDDTGSQVVLTLLTPYVAYIPADRAHASGVLSTLTAAIFLGTRGRGVFQPASRVATEAFWRVLVFLVESLVFVLVGLEARGLVNGVRHYPPGRLALDAGLVVLAVIGVRMLWEICLPPLLRKLVPRARPPLPLPLRLVTGWCGLRGAVTIAVALSLPETLKDGTPFPQRELMTFLALVVVLVTLILQGGTLPFLLRWLKIAAPPDEKSELVRARTVSLEAAVASLDAMDGDASRQPLVDTLRATYATQLDELRGRLAPDEPQLGPTISTVRLEVIGAQREALRQLYDDHKIGSESLRTLNRELDLLEARLRKEFGQR